MHKNKTVVICTNLPSSLFGEQIVKLFEAGIATISINEDIDPKSFIEDENHLYFFAYTGTVPEGVKKIATSIKSYPSSMNIFCNKAEIEEINAQLSSNFKAPSFVSGIQILSAFIDSLNRACY